MWVHFLYFYLFFMFCNMGQTTLMSVYHAPDIVLDTQFQVNDVKRTALQWCSTLHISAEQSGNTLAVCITLLRYSLISKLQRPKILPHTLTGANALSIHILALNSHQRHIYKCYYKQFRVFIPGLFVSPILYLLYEYMVGI